VQSVGADHQVEPPRSGLLEGHVHAVAGVVDRRDRVAEDVLHVRPRRVVQKSGERAAEDLDVPVRDACVEPLDVHLERSLAIALEHQQVVAGAGVLDLVPQLHPTGHVDRGAEQVDRMAGESVPHGRCAFHDRRLEAVPPQPVGEHRTSHARTGDQHLRHDTLQLFT
jgi:hypothetical protein